MSSSAKGKNTTFKKLQQIVYPLQGVGQIQDIIEMDFKGEKTLYYVIYLPVSDMTVKIPVDPVLFRRKRPKRRSTCSPRISNRSRRTGRCVIR